MAQKTSAGFRFQEWIARIGWAGWAALAVSMFGLALRIEHAVTFDGPGRGSDYASNVEGVYWMLKHWRGARGLREVWELS